MVLAVKYLKFFVETFVLVKVETSDVHFVFPVAFLV